MLFMFSTPVEDYNKDIPEIQKSRKRFDETKNFPREA